MITFAVLVANLLVDIIIVLFDPRARAREATVKHSTASGGTCRGTAKVGVILLGFFAARRDHRPDG